MPDRSDFFVSYNHLDQSWAEWIAWQLEDAGYAARIQAWDFRPGSNFVLEMHRSLRSAERLLLVLSQNFFGSDFTQAEWSSAFAEDASAARKKLLPVRVAECNPEGLLRALVYIDLVGRDETAARAELLAGVVEGRAKPTSAPRFPASPAPIFPANENLTQPIPEGTVLERAPDPVDLQKDESWNFDDVDVDVDGEEAVKDQYNSLFWPSVEGTWQSTISGGAYRLTNTGARDDRHWVVFAPTAEQDPDGSIQQMLAASPISVEVRVSQAVRAFGTGAGIIYRFQEQPRQYYTFMLMHDGQVRFAVSRAAGERELYKGRHNAVVTRDFNRLTLISADTRFFLYVNDVCVAKVENTESIIGGLGMVASGTGEFEFRNLTIYRKLLNALANR